MDLNFTQARQYFKEKGFYIIKHPVVIHHMLKDFSDYDVINSRFYILPVGQDFLHVALIEHEQFSRDQAAVQIRYTCAGDDLLYGLRTKYNSGGSYSNNNDLVMIEALIATGNLRDHPRYIRKRFRHGRTKAKIRAFMVVLKDIWKSTFSLR